MIDGQQADDKIIAVLESDLAYGGLKNIGDVPKDWLIDPSITFSCKQLPSDAQGRSRLLMFMITTKL
jgi:inorganic pyrophosphatase